MSEWFAIVVQAPDPRERVRRLPDGALSEAVAEIEQIPQPNAF